MREPIAALRRGSATVRLGHTSVWQGFCLAIGWQNSENKQNFKACIANESHNTSGRHIQGHGSALKKAVCLSGASRQGAAGHYARATMPHAIPHSQPNHPSHAWWAI